MRRRRTSPGNRAEPESANWRSYQPDDARYWFYGGPWIPPEQIAGKTQSKPHHIRPHEKPATRLASIIKMLADLEKKLPAAIAYYCDLHERGLDALRWDWERERIRDGACKRDEPNAYHIALKFAYRDIQYGKGEAALYERLIAELSAELMPLISRLK